MKNQSELIYSGSLNTIDNKIYKKLSTLSQGYWDFKTYNQSETIHSLHNYPAVMIAPISDTILKIVTSEKRIKTILDPFAGSGTVLAEAQKYNIDEIIGNDLNPLALLISKAKTLIIQDEDIISYKNVITRTINALENKKSLIDDFDSFIRSTYGITSKYGWGSDASIVIQEYFSKDKPDFIKFIPNIKNLGYWFQPNVTIQLAIIKEIFHASYDSKIETLLKVTLSELVRYVSNTRNGEFKLFRISTEKLETIKYDVSKELTRIVDKNHKIFKMMIELQSSHGTYPRMVKLISNDSRYLNDVVDESVDLIITSPPYGDSHTTVAYGQFSRLSSQWLNQIDQENIDNALLGGKKKSVIIESLGSETLNEYVGLISEVDKNRANEVLHFYQDLDDCLRATSRKTVKGGYHFWVVGNRTVKNIKIPTDEILIEMAQKHGLELVERYYRNISNKVMPHSNSPTNEVGKTVSTMSTETIIFFKKI